MDSKTHNVVPIIVLGVERSGTTLLYSILANHPELYWLSRLDSMFPRLPRLCGVIRRGLEAVLGPSGTYRAVPGEISLSRGLIPPSECLSYWRLIFGWGDEEDYLIEDDYFDESDIQLTNAAWLQADFALRLRTLGKKRLLLKQPGFALKIRYLNTVFPDAIFLHMVRNPRDNVRSLVRAKRQSKERFWGTKIPGWRKLVNLPVEYQAVHQVATVLGIIQRDVSETSGLSRRYMTISYEELTSAPRAVISKICTFCNLQVTGEVEEAFKYIRPRPNVSRPQLEIPHDLDSIIARVEQLYGYA